MDDSVRDIYAISKSVGSEIKNFLKDKNATYKASLKELIKAKFQFYSETLISKLNELHLANENEVQGLKTQIEKCRVEYDYLNDLIYHKKSCQTNIINKHYELRLKSVLFNFLKQNVLSAKFSNKKENQMLYFYINNLKKKVFSMLKNKTIFKPFNVFEREIQIKYEEDIRKIKQKQYSQKEELKLLIIQAKEKLNHEKRKKIQTKLVLDNVVLKGVSAMNLKALALSNDSLKGKVVYFNTFHYKYIFNIIEVYSNNIASYDRLTLKNTNSCLKYNSSK
jgi:hypothetical protein